MENVNEIKGKSSFGGGKMKEECVICCKETVYNRVNEECPVFECSECKKTTILHIPALNIKLNNASFIHKEKQALASYISSLIDVSSDKMYEVLCSENSRSQRTIALIKHMENKSGELKSL